jgi:all-trans-retinol 13,14-reductase
VRVRPNGSVICGAGAVVTNRLVPERLRGTLAYEPMLRAVPPSISHAYVFVGLDGTTESLGLPSSNLWVLPTSTDGEFSFTGPGIDGEDDVGTEPSKAAAGPTNPWERHALSVEADASEQPAAEAGAEAAGEEEDELLMFMSFPSARDPSFSTRYPGKSTACIITTAPTKYFARFCDDLEALPPKAGSGSTSQSGRRGRPAYDALKAVLKAKLLRGLHRQFPKTIGKVSFVDVGTPLSNHYYLGRADSYGLEHTPAHYAGALTALRVRTNIPGLLVTGQDVTSVGVVGALNGGILTAHACLGYTAWDLIVRKRNLIEDLMAMDKQLAHAAAQDKHDGGGCG